ncbi:CRISPR-associated protein Cas4 [Thermoleptolyngbya sp. C42_A2020_037]|uniref:CRISPR-associated protein Cas4 n=1 Tax=Thermoleptolyngbya sp. C42_A2020_037 TaxID=2747799 RepID=UPI001A0E040A|nr:CRISPR-associated protein Cas4 [Thermoleptolyngbya sp. C42_A2020_037]MBF2084340.1 CRISPR-associated protein Cas4 [Thermoleptolyngbya sp. C42_A2020_037]
MNLEDVPIAALNQYTYCPHRCWRMFCAGEFVDNHYTLEGTGLHDRVHSLGAGHREETWQVRAIWLRSERYGLVGKADLIEAENGKYYPVEYKRSATGEFENDALQVCAQALCLEEMTGQPVTMGYVYYAQSHQRQAIALTPELRQRAIATIDQVKTLLETGTMPPAVYTPRCKGCSLYAQCLPRAAAQVNQYQEKS